MTKITGLLTIAILGLLGSLLSGTPLPTWELAKEWHAPAVSAGHSPAQETTGPVFHTSHTLRDAGRAAAEVNRGGTPFQEYGGAVTFALGLLLLNVRLLLRGCARAVRAWPLGILAAFPVILFACVGDPMIGVMALAVPLIGSALSVGLRRARSRIISVAPRWDQPRLDWRPGLCLTLCLAAVCAFGPAIPAAHASPLTDVMIRPVSAWGGYSQGAGLLDQTGYVSGVTNVASYLATNPNAGTAVWSGQGTGSAWEPGFDLGTPTILTGFVLWNGNDYYGQALTNAHLVASNDLSQYTDLGWFYFNPTNGLPQWQAFSQPIETRYIVFEWYTDDGNGFSAEIDEVAFTGPGAPEPASWSLGALGMAALAISRKRRRRCL